MQKFCEREEMLKRPAVLKSPLLLKSYANLSFPRLLKYMKEVSRRAVEHI